MVALANGQQSCGRTNGSAGGRNLASRRTTQQPVPEAPKQALAQIPTPTVTESPMPGSRRDRVWAALLGALAGGLIPNLMPYVFSGAGNQGDGLVRYTPMTSARTDKLVWPAMAGVLLSLPGASCC